MTVVEELFARHYAPLVRLAAQLVDDPDSAEDVVQDVFAALDATTVDDALPYLRRAVVNRSRSVLRRRGVEARHHAEAPAARPGADEDALAGERRTQVLDALRALPDRQREVLALRYYLDLSEAQIAETLGISRGAVKSHASRGAASLRHLLEDAS